MQRFPDSGAYGVSTFKKSESAVETAVEFICENFDQEIDLDDIATAAGVTKFYLCRRFQRSFGMSVMGWVWRLRAHLARELMVGFPNLKLTDVAFSCGFNSSSHFSRFYRRIFSLCPSHTMRPITHDVGQWFGCDPREYGTRAARSFAFRFQMAL